MRKTVDNKEIFYDGEGEFSDLHATIYAHHSVERRFLVELIIDRSPTRGESWTYGETAPLTRKMAEELAERWCNRKGIPKRLAWR